jgi:hypothetical protein
VNAHLNRIVEGPLASDTVAANDADLALSAAPARNTSLTLVPAPAESNPVPADSNTENTGTGKTTEGDDYVLGGYAGI